jgi:hypothetical protein
VTLDADFQTILALRDVAARDGGHPPFAASFEAMRKRQLRRRGFFDRWKHANAPDRGSGA